MVKVRQYLEVDGETFMPVNNIRNLPEPERQRILDQAGKVIASELKGVLHGLGPLCGRERLLCLVTNIIEEDFNPEGPQTPMPPSPLDL